MQNLETMPGAPEPEAASRDRDSARREFTSQFNQLLRRLRSYSNEAEWNSAVIEGASYFAEGIALFTVHGEQFEVRGQYGLALPAEFVMPTKTAGAFVAAVSSNDAVVALRTPSEVGQALSSPDRSDRAHLYPVWNGSRVVAVLFASGKDRVDTNGLELLAGVASLALQRPQNATLHTQIAPAPQRPNNRAVPSRSQAEAVRLPNLTRLPAAVRDLHHRAMRFSRTKVAEMEISKPEACRAGRKENNYYLFLKREIDAARDSYRKQFMQESSVPDYFHLELVRASVDGDEQKLGADYPGQLS